MIFIDLEKAYDWVPIVFIWWVLGTTSYIDIIKGMYKRAVTSIRTKC